MFAERGATGRRSRLWQRGMLQKLMDDLDLRVEVKWGVKDGYESVAFIKSFGSLVDGIDCDRIDAELFTEPSHAPQRIEKKCFAKTLSLNALVDGKLSHMGGRNRIARQFGSRALRMVF